VGYQITWFCWNQINDDDRVECVVCVGIKRAGWQPKLGSFERTLESKAKILLSIYSRKPLFYSLCCWCRALERTSTVSKWCCKNQSIHRWEDYQDSVFIHLLCVVISVPRHGEDLCVRSILRMGGSSLIGFVGDCYEICSRSDQRPCQKQEFNCSTLQWPLLFVPLASQHGSVRS
jgi:hypothetical protein